MLFPQELELHYEVSKNKLEEVEATHKQVVSEMAYLAALEILKILNESIEDIKKVVFYSNKYANPAEGPVWDVEIAVTYKDDKRTVLIKQDLVYDVEEEIKEVVVALAKKASSNFYLTYITP